MATIVFMHAHPDDEAIATGGSMLQAAEDGHRVVLIVATKGEHGEYEKGFLRPGETLAERRVIEQMSAAEILGVHRVEFLGYVDSGMIGTPENEGANSFWTADIEEAATKVADILREEDADVLTVYDEHGNYGHPDHIQVHRVGIRAAEMAGTRKVYEGCVSQSRIRRMMQRMAELDQDLGVDEETMPGIPDELVTTTIDVRKHLSTKRSAMAAHASQIPETSFFLTLPPPDYEEGFGFEEYSLRGAPPGLKETSLYADLPPKR
jgi:LmbE family N-acetylglucosaminyl deacetylase